MKRALAELSDDVGKFPHQPLQIQGPIQGYGLGVWLSLTEGRSWPGYTDICQDGAVCLTCLALVPMIRRSPFKLGRGAPEKGP